MELCRYEQPSIESEHDQIHLALACATHPYAHLSLSKWVVGSEFATSLAFGSFYSSLFSAAAVRENLAKRLRNIDHPRGIKRDQKGEKDVFFFFWTLNVVRDLLYVRGV